MVDILRNWKNAFVLLVLKDNFVRQVIKNDIFIEYCCNNIFYINKIINQRTNLNNLIYPISTNNEFNQYNMRGKL